MCILYIHFFVSHTLHTLKIVTLKIGDITTYLENEYNNTNVLSGLRSFDVCECIVRFQRLCVLYF